MQRINGLFTAGLSMVVLMITQFAALSALAADDIPSLELYKSGSPAQGLWRVEMLGSDDAQTNKEMNSAAGKMNGMSICMDAAKKMYSNPGSTESQHKCTTKIVRNTSSVAEVDAVCEDGAHTHMTMTREDSKSMLLNSTVTNKEGKTRNFKARYHYEGPCKGDSLIQADKNSETCKKMANVDMSQMASMCTRMPPERRAQCELQVKNMAGMCK